MQKMFARLVWDDQGQDLIEYVLIGSLVSVAVVIGATALGGNLQLWYQALADWAGRRIGDVPTT
jgi:pilus assembly protein Flp/PilA